MKTAQKKKCKNSEGFTLIEVLVVVVIIGVLGAIAAPGWLSFLTRQKMSAVNSDLLNTLKATQADAIQQSTRKQVTISSVGSSPYVTVSNFGGGHSYSQELGTDTSNLQLSVLKQNDANNWVAATEPVTIDFDHRGRVNASSNIPLIIQVETQDTSFNVPPRCVIVTTLLGGLVMESGNICNTFSANE